jgi:hypothetical protein
MSIVHRSLVHIHRTNVLRANGIRIIVTLTKVKVAVLTTHLIGLYHPLDGITNPKNKLMCFITTNFLQRGEGTSFKPGLVLPSSALFTADSLHFY